MGHGPTIAAQQAAGASSVDRRPNPGSTKLDARLLVRRPNVATLPSPSSMVTRLLESCSGRYRTMVVLSSATPAAQRLVPRATRSTSSSPPWPMRSSPIADRGRDNRRPHPGRAGRGLGLDEGMMSRGRMMVLRPPRGHWATDEVRESPPLASTRSTSRPTVFERHGPAPSQVAPIAGDGIDDGDAIGRCLGSR